MYMNADELRRRGNRMVDFVADYWESMRSRHPTANVKRGYMKELVPDKIPKKGEAWDKIFDDLEGVIIKGTNHWQHPHFFSYWPTAVSYPAIVGDILSAGLGIVGFTWIASPACTELELVVIDWLAKMLKLPNHFLNSDPGPGTGMIQCSSTDSVLMALLGARSKVMKEQKSDTTISKLVAYCSEYANTSVEKACLLSAVMIRKVATDNCFAVQASALEEVIAQDKENGLIPFFVCATLGTPATCAFDNLPDLGLVCQQHGLWLHVDASYAGGAFICPEYRQLLEGIEFADSFCFNPHSLLQINFDCSAVWFKDAQQIQNAFMVDPVYLKYDHQGEIPDFRNLQIPLERRFRSLKIWFVIRAFGVIGLQQHIRSLFNMAKILSQFVILDERFELMTPVKFGIVLFRLKGSDQLNRQFHKLIMEDRRIHLLGCELKGKFYLRIAICSSMADKKDMENAWNILVDLVSNVLVSRWENSM